MRSALRHPMLRKGLQQPSRRRRRRPLEPDSSSSRSRCSCATNNFQLHAKHPLRSLPRGTNTGTRWISTNEALLHGEDAAVSTDNKSGDAIYDKTTKRLLLDAPLGSFDSRTWYEAEWTVRFWNRQRSVQSVKYSLDLLDRFIREYCHQCQETNRAMPLPTVLTTANLNFTVNNWQLCAKSCPTPANRSDLPNPTEMVEIIDALVCYHKSVPAITDHRESCEHFPLQPNIYTYSMILDALAFSQPDKPQLEYEILEELGDSTINKNKDAHGNIGWTYLETPAPVLADLLLYRLLEESQLNPYMRPSVVTFNTVINVWARSRLPEAPEKAEALLRQVQQLSCEPGWESLKPTNATYGSVLNTWGNSIAEGAPARAHALLQEMKDSSDPEIYPNTEIYLGVLKAWGRSQDSQAAARASSVLHELISKYRESLDQNKQGNKRRSTKIHLTDVKPSVQCFLSVMNIFANNGDTKGASRVLDQLQALYEESGYDGDLCPNAATFNGVIRAWSRSTSKEAVAYVEGIIERMQKLAESTDNSDLYPDVVSYNSLLHTLSKSDDPGVVKRAEEVFQTMLDAPEIEPDLISYNVVLYLLGRSKQEKAGEKSEDFLRTFWDQYKAGIIDFKPDATSYNTCIDAWKYSQRKNDQVKRAESLFLDMQAQFRETGDTRLKPTRVSYGSMIAAWGRANPTRYGAKRAQLYFEEMIANGISPTIIEYNAAIHAWANIGGVEEGEKLLQKALEDYQNGNQLAKPNVKSFSSVLNALAKRKSSDPVSDAAKAEAILVQMEELSATLGPGVKPNAHSFNAVLDCFAKCRQNEVAAKHAEAILGHMKALSDAGNETVKPNVISVTTVMNCWVYSNSREAPERVEKLFQFLKDQFQMTGDKAMQPSQYTYNALIGAYARNSKRADSVEKAMGHFNRMMEDYDNSHENDIKPGPMHFSVVLSALAKRGLAEEAEEFLERVLTICRQYHDAGTEKLEISSSFNNVISAHARSNLAGSALKAEKTLRRMQDLDPNNSFIEAFPNVVSYTSVMMAWSRAFHPEDKRIAVAQCQQLLQEMLEQAKAGDRSIMPNCMTFGTYLQVVSRSAVTDKKERAEQVLQFMEQCGIRPDQFVLSAVKCCSS